MSEEPTTAVVQRYLNALAGDASAEPIVRELLDRTVHRLGRLWARADGWRRQGKRSRNPSWLPTGGPSRCATRTAGFAACSAVGPRP